MYYSKKKTKNQDAFNTTRVASECLGMANKRDTYKMIEY